MTGDLVSAVRSGDRRVALVALRDVLAERIACGVDDRDLAALVLRLQSVLAELGDGAGDGAVRGSVTDALAARRKAKEAASG